MVRKSRKSHCVSARGQVFIFLRGQCENCRSESAAQSACVNADVSLIMKGDTKGEHPLVNEERKSDLGRQHKGHKV